MLSVFKVSFSMPISKDKLMKFWQLKNPTYMYQNITVKYVMKLKK